MNAINGFELRSLHRSAMRPRSKAERGLGGGDPRTLRGDAVEKIIALKSCRTVRLT